MSVTNQSSGSSTVLWFYYKFSHSAQRFIYSSVFLLQTLPEEFTVFSFGFLSAFPVPVVTVRCFHKVDTRLHWECTFPFQKIHGEVNCWSQHFRSSRSVHREGLDPGPPFCSAMGCILSKCYSFLLGCSSWFCFVCRGNGTRLRAWVEPGGQMPRAVTYLPRIPGQDSPWSITKIHWNGFCGICLHVSYVVLQWSCCLAVGALKFPLASPLHCNFLFFLLFYVVPKDKISAFLAVNQCPSWPVWVPLFPPTFL